jgi:tetratricopeptide (TPR) repeat protein
MPKMKILLLNDAYFLVSLKALGHKVFFAGPAPEADLRVGLEPVEVSDVLNACPFQPDLLLLSDSINLRAAYTGWEKLEIPCVFYGVDSPMNAFWQFDFSRIFDLTFLDQKEPVERLKKLRPEAADRIHWLPLGADHRLYRRQPAEKIYDIAFVGSVNYRLRPKRSWLLEELKRHFNVAIFDGQGKRSLSPAQVVEIHHQSRLVLNENLFPGLNLRLLEAMNCGACVLTEESDGSWSSFFQDGVHLTAFNSRNLVEKAALLLQNEELRQRIGDQALTAVQGCHTVDHRAQTLLRETFKVMRGRSGHKTDKSKTFHLGKTYLALASRWRDQPVGKLSEEAVRLLCEEASQGRESADLHYELGARALGDGRLQDAAGSLRRSVQLDPAHLRSVWALFWCLRESGYHRAAATELFRLCRQLQVRTSRRFLDRVRQGQDFSAEDFLFMGKILEKAGWLMEVGVDRLAGHPSRWNAYDCWQKALHLDPSLTEAAAQCARVLETGPAPEFAVPFLEKLVDAHPLNSELRFRLAALLLNYYRRADGLNHILHYLFTSSEADWWDRVESLKPSESEWTFLLDAVLDYSRKSEQAVS